MLRYVREGTLHYVTGTLKLISSPIVTSVWYFIILTFLEYGCLIHFSIVHEATVATALVDPVLVILILIPQELDQQGL